MKKVLIVSDSHLENEILRDIIEKNHNCDYFVHCGDSCLDHLDPLLNHFITVRGNHDEDNDFLMDRFFTAENHRFFVTHGHIYDIYKEDEKIIEKAKIMNCDIILHGHTHIPRCFKKESCLVVNPGSVMFNRGTYGFGTYAIMTLDCDNIEVHFFHHVTHEIVDELVLNDGIQFMAELRKYIK